MKKIISLFRRNFSAPGNPLTRFVTPGAEWVQAGEGRATRKWDGTSCLIRGGVLFKRFDAKQGKPRPAAWEACQEAPDPETGHWPGWVPALAARSEDRWHVETFAKLWPLDDGTYELCGPKINGNPEKFEEHVLIRHGVHEVAGKTPRDFDGLLAWFTARSKTHDAIEGIVWHHPDGRMAKIKTKDFEIPR